MALKNAIDKGKNQTKDSFFHILLCLIAGEQWISVRH
jgi:hypothetical protein